MDGLIRPSDTIERQRDKLLNICTALMNRVEQAPTENGNAFAQFERAALLDAQVRQRTEELQHALDLLNESNAKLAEANRETERSRATLNDAIESVDEGLALFDRNDRLILFNTRFCRDFADVRPRLQLAMPFEDFVDVVSKSSDLALPLGIMPANWAARRMERHNEDRVVFNISLTEDRWIQVSEQRTNEGGTAILQTDISDVMRKQMQERKQLVSDQDKMLRATLDHLAQGVCIFDRHARLVGWNREIERMIQVPGRFIRLGTPFSKIFELMKAKMEFAGANTTDLLVEWSAKESGRQPIEFELHDTRSQIFDVFAQEMPDHGFVMSLTDVTTERVSAQQLRELNKTLELRVAERTKELGAALREAESANVTKNRFVAAASHDLLQPLSAAKLYLATLQDADQIDQIGIISDKASRALKGAEDIIEALLDISKLDAGHAAFDVQPFPVQTLLQSISNEMAPIAEDKGLSLKIMPTSAAVVSDPVFFRRVLQNLISNAIKYTDRGRILVGVRSSKRTVKIEVHDTGAGIAPDDQKRIFREFTRLEDSHSGAKGIGLGLAIVERACSALGHELHLSSTLGKGSCFAVGAARHIGGKIQLADAKDREEFEHAIGGKMLLLVENDEDLAHALTLRLERSGVHVVHAPTGEDALTLLAEIELLPDAALLDYQLGRGMNGVELHEIFGKRYDAVPTFMLSADRSTDFMLMCEDRNLRLVPKPIDIEELLGALNSVFRQAY